MSWHHRIRFQNQLIRTVVNYGVFQRFGSDKPPVPVFLGNADSAKCFSRPDMFKLGYHGSILVFDSHAEFRVTLFASSAF